MDRNRKGKGSAVGVDSVIDATGKSLFWKFVAGLNKALNPGHAWTDYQSKNDSMVDSWLRKESGVSLTGAEQQANLFNAEEAEKQRLWEEHMSSTAYQRQVADMRAAGVNPAMAMNGASGASTPSGSSATSVSPTGPGFSFSDLMQLVMLPLQKKLVRSQADLASKQGEAALINANANARNAETNVGNLGVNQQNADTNRMNAETAKFRAGLEEMRTKKELDVSDAQIGEISERAALLGLQREQLPQQLAIAEKNADSQARSALASLRQADAAQRNAAINEKLSVPQEQILWCEKVIKWYDSEGKRILTEKLPDRLQLELENLKKEGILLDNRGALVNGQGDLVNGQVYRTWIDVASGILNLIPGPPMSKYGGTGMNADMIGSLFGSGT